MSQADSTSSGIDNLDSKILKLVVNSVATPICHIFNQCLIKGVHPTAWKEAKIIPLLKDENKTFNGPNSRPISILPLLSKIIEKIVFIHIFLLTIYFLPLSMHTGRTILQTLHFYK